MRKTLAEELRLEIGHRKMNQRQAASEMKTDPANVSRWLKGGDVDKPEHIRALTVFLHIDQDKLGALTIEQKMRTQVREISER